MARAGSKLQNSSCTPQERGFKVQRLFPGYFSHKHCVSKWETLPSRNDSVRPALALPTVGPALNPPAHTPGYPQSCRSTRVTPGSWGSSCTLSWCSVQHQVHSDQQKPCQHSGLNCLSVFNGGKEWLSQVLPLLWRPQCRGDGAHHSFPFLFYFQTHPRAGQSPVEPRLYPPFPPALISNAIPQRVKLPETSPHSQWFMFNLYKWRKWDFKFQCHFCNEVIKRERGIAFYCIEYWSQCYFP